MPLSVSICKLLTGTSLAFTQDFVLGVVVLSTFGIMITLRDHILIFMCAVEECGTDMEIGVVTSFSIMEGSRV